MRTKQGKGKRLTLKRRNVFKTEMDKYQHPKVFRSRKRTLEAKEHMKEMKEYFNG